MRQAYKQNLQFLVRQAKFSQQQEAVTTACTRGFNILRSCHLLAPVVNFTVVKSQAILLIRLGVAEVISAVTLYLHHEISTSLDMFRHNNFACGLCLSIVALPATMCLYNVSGGTN